MASKVCLSGLTTQSTKGNFVTTILRVLAPTHGPISELIQVNGETTRCMEREILCGLSAEKSIEENIEKIRSMDMER